MWGGCRREAAGRQRLSQMFELSEQVRLTDSPAGRKREESTTRAVFWLREPSKRSCSSGHRDRTDGEGARGAGGVVR